MPFLENIGVDVSTQNQQCFVCRVPKMIRFIKYEEHKFHLGRIKERSYAYKALFSLFYRRVRHIRVCMFILICYYGVFCLFFTIIPIVITSFYVNREY